MTDPDPPVAASEDLVRRVEPILWLTSRLATHAADRSVLVNLYAIHIELGRVASSVSASLAGEIRLAWWREEVEALAAGDRTPGHPALRALTGVGAQVVTGLQNMIEGRHADLEPRPFATCADVERYIDLVDGGLIQAACGALDPTWTGRTTSVARVLGWRRLLRDRPMWLAHGRDWAPHAVPTPAPVDPPAAEGPEPAARAAERAAYGAAKAQTVGAPARVFPAFAAAALPPTGSHGVEAPALSMRFRLLWATLRGRI